MGAEDEQLPVSYDVSIEGEIHPWGRDRITAAEIRELGDLPADCDVVVVDLATGQEHVLAEGDLHEIPPLDPGKPAVKRMNFKAG